MIEIRHGLWRQTALAISTPDLSHDGHHAFCICGILCSEKYLADMLTATEV